MVARRWVVRRARVVAAVAVTSRVSVLGFVVLVASVVGGCE